MSLVRIEADMSNPFLDEVTEEKLREEHIDSDTNNNYKVVPFIEFAFYQALTSDHMLMPGPDDDGDKWRASFEFDVAPLSQAVRVLIRPDVSKKEAKRILRKIIKLIDADDSDWQERVFLIIKNYEENN